MQERIRVLIGSRLFWPLVWMLCVAALQFLPRTGAELQVQMEAEREGIAQVYFDRGEPLNEAASVQRRLRPGSNWLVFPLPEGTYRGFRFDPTNNDGSVTIRRVALWRTGEPRPDEVLAALKPAANVAHYEAIVGGVRVVPTPAVNDAQLMLDFPIRLGGGLASFIADLFRGLLLTAVLWLCARLARTEAIELRGLVGASAVTAGGLILAMAIVSGKTSAVHPDEMSHLLAMVYHLTHGVLPPKVTDPDLYSSISLFGFSYLFELDIVYPLAALVLSPFGVVPGDAVLSARLFSFALWCVLLVFAVRRRSWAAVAAVGLVSPQVWYVFSYFNGDALPFLLSLIAVALASDPDGGVAAYLEHGRLRRGELALLILCCGLLLISKRNYLPVVPVIASWLAVRHLGLRFIEATFLVFGLALAGAGTILRAPMFGSPLPGGMLLLVLGALVFAVAAGHFLWRLRGEAARWPAFRRLALLLGLVVTVALPRVLWDVHQNGLPGAKRAVVAQIQEQRAAPDFKASVIEQGKGYFGLALAKKGVTLPQVALAPWHWALGSLRSAFGVYGFMSIFAPAWIYAVLIGNFALLVACGLLAMRRRSTAQWPTQVMLVGGGAFLVALSSLLHSWVNDFEAQGRYLFPAFAILALPLGAAVERLPRGVFRFCLVFGGMLSGLAFAFVALQAFAPPS